MQSLVIMHDNQPATTSLVIADHCQYDHATVIRLVRNHIDDLGEFGLIGFEIRPRPAGQHGGGDVEYAILNEQQATYLITLMNNNPVVRQFKKALVKAFFQMRDAIRADKTVNVNFNHSRGAGAVDFKISDRVLSGLPSHIKLEVVQRLRGVDLSDIIEKVTPVVYAEVQDFIDAICRIQKEAYTPSDLLYRSYYHYAQVVGKKAYSQVYFFMQLDEMFFSVLRSGESMYCGVEIGK